MMTMEISSLFIYRKPSQINYIIINVFFDKNKRYSFIQIGGVHRYNTNPNSLKTKMMNL